MYENTPYPIKGVSGDSANVELDMLLTAAAVEGKIPAAPKVVQFVDADLSGGHLVVPYLSGLPIVFYQMIDNENDSVLAPANFDPSGTFVDFDLSSIAGSIVDTWSVTNWTSTGPIGVGGGGPVTPIESDTGSVRLEPAGGPVNLEAVANFAVHKNPGTLKPK